MSSCDLAFPPQKPRVTADRVLPQLRLDEDTEEEDERERERERDIREGGGRRDGRYNVSAPGSPTLELKVPLQPANLIRSVDKTYYFLAAL